MQGGWIGVTCPGMVGGLGQGGWADRSPEAERSELEEALRC